MLKVAMLGMGGISGAHRSAWKQFEDAKVIACCDIRPEKADAAAEDLGCKAYYHYEDMAANEQYDILDICLPTYLHAEYAIKALNAGKHVLCEKPMAINPTQCRMMIDAAKANGKKLMIAQCLRFWPAYEQLKKLVDSGEWGKVVSAMFFRGGATPIWSYQDWLRKKEKSGGCLLDQHIHDVDMINWLFGTPEYVSTSAVNTIPGSGYDAVSTNYYYADGKVINAQDDWTINGDGFGFEMIFRVNFEKGAAILTRDGFKLMPVDGKAYTPDMPRMALSKERTATDS